MQTPATANIAVNRAFRFPRLPREAAQGAFFWLSAFYVVYCARPEDWIPGLAYVPMAKISGIFAIVGLLFGVGRLKRGLRDLPREAFYLLAMIVMLFISGFLSPVWKGGAVYKTIDFSKILIAWVLTFVVVSSFARLRRIIFVQSASVVTIAILSVLKGRDHPRLEGVIGGIYSNPNDLAFAIVLSLPFCLAFLLSTKSLLRRVGWMLAMLVMFIALFLTASRGGFITLLAASTVALWHFGVRGRRPQLVVAAVLVAVVVGVTAGGRLKDRFLAISEDQINDKVDVSAHGSFEQRRLLMELSLKTMLYYPQGLGLGNFVSYSGTWHDVHVAYLQIGVEGGILSLILYFLFFGRGFANLSRLRKISGLDKEEVLLAGALHSSLVGFVVGALFAPEAYQYFPYFAVAYTSVLLAIAKERAEERALIDLPNPPHKGRKNAWKAGELTGVRYTPSL
jgi:putative inorganic carbon (hco3(-)) transporter